MNDASETGHLLRFFSLTQAEQWRRVPDSMPPVWVSAGALEMATDKPILMLALILSGLLGRRSESPAEGLEDLLGEIKALLLLWMIESPFLYVFARREDLDERDKIWLVLRRLCLAALSQEGLCKPSQGELPFEHFLQRYTVPIDRDNFDLPIN